MKLGSSYSLNHKILRYLLNKIELGGLLVSNSTCEDAESHHTILVKSKKLDRLKSIILASIKVGEDKGQTIAPNIGER